MAAPGTARKASPSTAVDKTASPLDAGQAGDSALSAPSDAAPVPPPAPPIHQAAQEGNVEAIHRLLEAGEAKVGDRDASNVTPLHWAAINNHLLACKELLLKGAEVDAVGGDLQATPMQWAARNGHLPVVHLLVTHGADPAFKDTQGFDTFHLATHSSAPMLIAYLLSQQLPVATDAVDAAGRTCLQWACYQGDALSVDLLLKFGANPNRTDPGGLTALHWAVVKGNVGCLTKIIEAGADIWAKNGQGQTPLDLAKQVNSVAAWERTMLSLGREADGRPRSRTLNDRNTTYAVFALPWIFLFLIFSTLNILPWYTGLPLALGEFYGMHHIIVRVLLDVRPRPGGGMDERVTKSPYMCGIVSGSIFWVGYVWATKLVYNTPGMAYTNLAFAVALALCAYNLFRAIMMDPAYVPARPSDAALKEMVEELTTSGQMTGQAFCLPCLTRRPLRSKHCRLCDRCVARHDHHCPWIWNCVGVNNHRQFVLFVTFLIVGIVLFDRLVYAYFASAMPLDSPERPETCILPTPVCIASSFDTFAFACACWATLQLTWTIIVLGGQVWQICRQLTTYELSNLGRYGYMGGGGQSLAAQAGHASHARHGSASAALHSHQHTNAVGHTHAHGAGILRKVMPKGLLQLVGLDLYTQGKAAEGIARAHRSNGNANPFDTGLWRNCTDFWTRGRTLGVDYTNLYDVPDGGYKEVLKRRAREKQPAKVVANRGNYIMLPQSNDP